MTTKRYQNDGTFVHLSSLSATNTNNQKKEIISTGGIAGYVGECYENVTSLYCSKEHISVV